MRAMEWMMVGVVCLAASPGFAAKPVCGDGKCQGNEPRDCSEDCTGSGGCEAPGIVQTEARWGGLLTEERPPRACVASNVKPNGDHGTYACEVGAPLVHYALGTDWDQIGRKGDPDLCTVFEDIVLEPNWAYNYSWFDNCCEDDACTIRINNWFSGQQVLEETGGKADSMRLSAFAEATGPFQDPNPFVELQPLDVDEIRITFSAAGSNKGLAECLYRFEPGDVTFFSSPTP